MTAERDSMTLNEITFPALGVEERSDRSPRPALRAASPCGDPGRFRLERPPPGVVLIGV